jgi:transposase
MTKRAKKKTITAQAPNPKRTRARTRNNKITTNFQVSDELWDVFAPLLPEHKNTHRFGGGRPRVPDRQCADGIFFVLRTGCQWKALDKTDLCSGSTAHARFQEWEAAGVFLKFWACGLERFEELHGLDWNWLSMDGAMTKAPLGGEKKRAQSHGSSKKWGQAESLDRSAWDSDWVGGRRRQSQRHEIGARHP